MDNNIFAERINLLRHLMKERNIDIYIIPTSDFHQSEYVGDYFKVREYMSGFTGSAGTLVVTMDKAGLWTDGRYFLQADKELKGSGIRLYKMGEEGVPGIYDFLLEELPDGGTLGFDGRTVNSGCGEDYEEIAAVKGGSIKCDEDLAGCIWKDRPHLSCEKAYILNSDITGETRTEKISRIRQIMREKEADGHIIGSLDDIAWILNIRGNDVLYNPVVLSYLILTIDKCILFIQPDAVDEKVTGELESDGIEIAGYDEFWTYIGKLRGTILLDKTNISYAVVQGLDEETEVLDCENPSEYMKAVKTDAEIKGMKKAHVKDGLAVTRFMHWIKNAVGKETITELSAAEKLEEYRKQQEGYSQPSFETISAYADNGAIVHYTADKESDAELKAENFLLVDSGGQYDTGTTDITRTFVLGKITKEQKIHYTAVLKGMLALADSGFRYGCTGRNLDYAARKYLWDMGMDFNHGTGHGVGFILNVHEAPNSFRWRKPSDAYRDAVLEPGMITSDEPGLYIAGKYGIRIENLILCKEREKNEFGRFLEFEHLTMVPVDLDGVDIESMGKEDIKRLNSYHEMVYNTLSPHMSEDEREWLKEYTRKI